VLSSRVIHSSNGLGEFHSRENCQRGRYGSMTREQKMKTDNIELSEKLMKNQKKLEKEAERGTNLTRMFDCI
jgi:hypothetical protein